MKFAKISPTLRGALTQNIITFTLITVFMTFVLVFVRGEHWQTATAWGMGTGAVSFVWYIIRFYRSSPRNIYITEDGILMYYKDKRKEKIRWHEILRATYSDRGGGNWSLLLPSKNIHLWDDGFSSADWDLLYTTLESNTESIDESETAKQTHSDDA